MRILNTAKGRNSYVYPTLLLSNTATGLRFATVPTGALMDNCPAALMTEIAKYPPGTTWIDIMDGSALVRAVVGAVGDGEDLAATLGSNVDFESAEPPGVVWTRGSTWTITGGQAVASNTNGSLQQAVNTTIGALYKVSTDCVARTLGVYTLNFDANAGTEFTATGARSRYRTAMNALSNFGFGTAGGATSGTWNSIALQRVTGPSTSGALLFNSRAMATQSVLVNTFTSTNYNKASYTYKLWGNFKASGRGGYVR